jgi:hypothetical protein
MKCKQKMNKFDGSHVITLYNVKLSLSTEDYGQKISILFFSFSKIIKKRKNFDTFL